MRTGNAFVPFTRIIAVAMGAVLCFGIIVPIALKRHNVLLAVAVGAIFLVYVVANVLLWRRMQPRA